MKGAALCSSCRSREFPRPLLSRPRPAKPDGAWKRHQGGRFVTAAGCNEYPLKAACRWCLFQARAASAERARELVGTTGQSGRLSQDAARRAPMCVEAHLIPCCAAHGSRRRYRQAQRVGVRDGSPKGRDAGSMRRTTARSATPRCTLASSSFSRARKCLPFYVLTQ